MTESIIRSLPIELIAHEVPLRARLDVPVSRTSRCVILIPGASGKPFDERFDRLSKTCVSSGYAFFRYDWGDLEDTTLAALHEQLNSAIRLLQLKGYTHFVLLGKSFGGGVALTYSHALVRGRVLLAPAIGVGNTNIERVRGIKLGGFAHFSEIRVGEEMLRRISSPVLILHGTEDNVVGRMLINSIVLPLPLVRLVSVFGADHSLDTPAVASEIASFLAWE